MEIFVVMTKNKESNIRTVMQAFYNQDDAIKYIDHQELCKNVAFEFYIARCAII